MRFSKLLFSSKANFVVLFVSTLFVSFVSGGLTTAQIAFLLLFIFLSVLSVRGNALSAKMAGIVSRDDVNAFPFGNIHIVMSWIFGPLMILSAFFPWVTTGLTLGIVIFYARGLVILFEALKKGRLSGRKVLEYMEQHPFDVVFYVSGPKNSGYQINQWIPVAERMKVKSAICVRKFHLLKEIDETIVPVFYAHSLADVESVKKYGGARVFLYPANFQENVASLRHADVQHYFINHGESDKVVNQSKFLMAYDKLLVAGPLAHDRLKAAGLPLRDNQVEYVGRPQLEIFLEKSDAKRVVRRILYAPTWEGFVDEADYCSVSDFGVCVLEQILINTKMEVIFKPHPFTGLRRKSVRKSLSKIKSMEKLFPNLRVLGGDEKIYPYMNWCDLMIADIGSVVNDFLVTGKPVIVTSVQGLSLKALHEKFPTTQGAYIVEPGSDPHALLSLISKTDPLKESRNSVRQVSLGHFSESSLARFEGIICNGLNPDNFPEI